MKTPILVKRVLYGTYNLALVNSYNISIVLNSDSPNNV